MSIDQMMRLCEEALRRELPEDAEVGSCTTRDGTDYLEIVQAGGARTIISFVKGWE